MNITTSRCTTENVKSVSMAIGLAAVFVAASFMWQGSVGFNLWDEGYLWYGVQRVMAGETPLLDFMSYDPGRYYWSAALLRLFRADGIIALRLAVAAFQLLGLACALFLIASAHVPSRSRSLLFVLLSGTIFLLWMFPRHKLFDASIAIFLVGNLCWLIAHPDSGRFFWSGVATGLIAFFGRNHGVYGVIASLIVFAWCCVGVSNNQNVLRGLFTWLLGLCAGFSPMIWLCLSVPGFTSAFIDSVLFIFEQKATNLPIPVPWPWTVDFASTTWEAGTRALVVGLFFIAIVLFGIASLIWSFWRKVTHRRVSGVLVASSAVALPYAHFAYSRADVGHLAQGMFPLLIGCLAVLATQRPVVKWAGASVLALASMLVMFGLQPGWVCRGNQPCKSVQVSTDHLLIDPNTANDVQLLKQLVNKYATGGKSFMATPVWPGAYALFNRRSPMWAIYALWTRSPQAQQLDIERIRAAKPEFVLIFDLALDGRDELRFEKTNPLINQYVRENFMRVPSNANPAYQVYAARHP
jgi:hypothetical protein